MDRFLIVFAMWSAIGWILLGMGLRNFRDYRRKEAVERERAEATIVDYEERTSIRKGHVTYSYLPILRYTAREETFEARDEFTMDPKEFPVGTVLEVLYDPTRPRDYHLTNTPGTSASAARMAAIGGVWIVAAFLGVLILHAQSGGYGWDLGDALRSLFR